ncbi:MAG: class I SAM-dependent methyltransferase [Candidatus Korobacteraceae bacterium]
MPSGRLSYRVTEMAPSAGLGAYAAKPGPYFAGARIDFVEDLPDDPNAVILEIGCGSGGTGRLAIAKGKCARYYGVELNAQAACEAAEVLHEVICGDVEAISLPWASEQFDALLMSEVLEHLADPWSVLRKLHPLLKPGALVLAGSPNVAHYQVIMMLLRGDWQLTDSGVMDRTHLRWFTPRTYARMFEETGYEVLSTMGIGTGGLKARIASKLLLGRCEWLWARQIKVTARRR